MNNVKPTPTITATTKITKALAAAAGALSKQLAEVETFQNTVTDLAFQIECSESELAAVNEELDTNKRRAVAELSLAILENKQEQLNNLLEEQGMASISQKDLESLQDALALATSNLEETVSTAVNAAVSRTKSAADLATKEMEAAHSVANADKDAQIKSLGSEVKMLQDQMAQLQETIKEERTARVSIATAAASQPVHVAAPAAR